MTNQIYGYARVSSTEQNLDRQILQLTEYVDEKFIITDKASGKDLDRPGYTALMGPLGMREGDTLYICSLDRLSRKKEDIKKELDSFKEKGIRLIVLDLPTTMIKVSDGQEWIIEMIQNILLEVLSSIAEQEREAIRKRQREGINAARAKGKHLGRPKLKIPNNFDEVYSRWKNGMITARAAQRETGMSSASFYRLIKNWERISEGRTDLRD